MNLLDTYISEIGRRLPRRNHKDIEAEIRSTIEDILEERSGKSGQPVDEDQGSGIDEGIPRNALLVLQLHQGIEGVA